MNIKNKGFYKLILFQILDALVELESTNAFTLGITNFINYLKGNLCMKFINLNIHKNHCFGVLESFEASKLKELITIGIIEEYIDIEQVGFDNELSVLKATDKGCRILEGEIDDIEIDDDLLTKNNIDLFMQLVSIRNKIVEEFNINPIRICSNKILQELSIKTPTSIEEMSQIPGIGEYFIDNFSNVFIDFFESYTSKVSKHAM